MSLSSWAKPSVLPRNRIKASVKQPEYRASPSPALIALIRRLTTLAPRSRSSPSPSPSARPRDAHRRAQRSKRGSVSKRPVDLTHIDWSTSYAAGESSSASHSESDDDDSETEELRGRVRLPEKVARNNVIVRRVSFTRSRSPHPRQLQPALSPIVSLLHRRKLASDRQPILSRSVEFCLPIPFSRNSYSFSIDSRRAGESLILWGSLFYATVQIAHEPAAGSDNLWSAYELSVLLAATVVYIVYTYGSVGETATRPATGQGVKSADKFGFIWMSVPKNYRESNDDGILTALLLGPLIAASLLCASFGGDGLPARWAIEAPFRLAKLSPQDALLRGRYTLLSLSTLTSGILLVHVCASRWLEDRSRLGASATENGPGQYATMVGPSDGERRSVPRSEGVRSVYFILFTLCVTVGFLAVRAGMELFELGFWQHLDPVEITISAVFYQLTLYGALRMAHRGLTLGELGFVCFGGAALFSEFLRFTTARLWSKTTPGFLTFRLPTPILVLQMALVGGPFLAGALMAPFLVLSRHAAKTPVRRRRRLSPAEALQARRRLAAAFYIGVALVVVGPIGLWVWWCLGKRNPWMWVLRWIVSRNRRLALLAYWATLGGLSVAGWTRQLARSRRGAVLAMGMGVNMTGGTANSDSDGATQDGSARSALIAASGELFDRAPTLRLNARRKFFHALVVFMFVPGIAFDPAFTHLAFSTAFALFVFAEYIRYFAIYPLGAAVHRFMSEFIDTKDGGTAILSHFYLLTGCAGALWLEGSSPLLEYTGLLVLGVGDAVASIVGKRIGRHLWSPTTPKTLEGSMAFIISVVASALVLRLCGLAEPFSIYKYSAAVVLASILEALSDQNDNLTLPLYTWSILVLGKVS
ncbi:unnamed protein product [Mycena citricolor]|uniref:dolichol kinase n=1 Tax=Mycena citricolor TaxID=2018698 RepID=A0AAD2Q328_9AGAR|nr:unnamed protein product [Mycena citricolor]